MAVTPISALPNVPYMSDISIYPANASGGGTINVGDWVAFSGLYIKATNSGHTAYWKTSGAGIALESNPVYDPAGRQVQNSALKVLKQGILLVSASFSGNPARGLGVYPDASGSGVAAPAGRTGVGATWNTAAVVTTSGATALGQHAPVATLIDAYNFGNGGTGQLVILLMPLDPDIRG